MVQLNSQTETKKMLLADQVDILRQNAVHLRDQQLVLPLMGGSSATSEAYQFKSLLHPARDIATTIANADPAGQKLPTHLRGWNLSVTDGFGDAMTIHLRKLLGMIIHVYYLNVSENRLDISNDLGERVIVPYDVFVASVERLLLTDADICLVICALVEERVKSKSGIQALQSYVPGSGDLMHCLATIGKLPALKEKIWTMFFAHQVTVVARDCPTVDDMPFLKSSRRTGNTIAWKVGWRRDDVYASAWISVSELISQIRSHFDSQGAGQ